MMAQFKSIGKAEAAFRGMIGFVKKAVESGELRIDEVERTLLGGQTRHPHFIRRR